MAADTLAFIKAGLDIAKGTRDLLASPKERRSKDDKLSEDLCRALRFIYFPENGVLGVLREIVGARSSLHARVSTATIDLELASGRRSLLSAERTARRHFY